MVEMGYGISIWLSPISMSVVILEIDMGMG